MILKNLHKGRFIKRYKRFFSDVKLNTSKGEEVIVAHCPNTGSMRSLIDIDEPLNCYVSKSNNPKRKLGWTFEFLELPEKGYSNACVLINTRYPNLIVGEWLETKMALEILGVKSIVSIKAEPRLGEGRSDFFVETNCGNIWIEVKNVTYGYDGLVSFPDSVSTRASRHLGELQSQIEKGDRAIALFLISREDASYFSLSNGIDTLFDSKLNQAMERGVEVLPLKTKFQKINNEDPTYDLSLIHI